MADRQTTHLLKRSNVSGKVPTIAQLKLGEVGLNTADSKLYTEYTGGATGATEVRAIGWDRLSTESGGTVNGDIIISGGSLINPNYIDFNTNYTGGTVEGRLHWDADNGTISLGMDGGNVVQQIGEETYYHVKNQSGATIQNGRVVRASGTLGASGQILAEYMIADGSIEPRFTLGLATEEIPNGEFGFVTEFGLVRGIDTTGSLYSETWSDGDILYVSSTVEGGLTNVEPLAPNLHIEIALVIHSDANGSLFVRPHRYPFIKDLQDVRISGTPNNLDILQYRSDLDIFENTNSPQFVDLSADTISILNTPTNDDGLTQLLAREPSTGEIQYRDAVSLLGSGFSDTYVASGTFATNTLTLTRSDAVDVIVTGFTDLFTTGGTYNGGTQNIDFSGNSPSTSFSVDVSPLLDDTNIYVTGGSVNYITEGDGTLQLDRNNDTQVSITGFTDYYITGATFSNNEITITRNDGNDILLTGITDFYTTGVTLNGTNLDFSRNDQLSAYTVDLASFLDDTNTYVTGFTYDDANRFTITRNDLTQFTADINTMTGLTVNGDLTSTTISATSVSAETLTVNGTTVVGLLKERVGIAAGTGFTGNPKKFTVTFATAFDDANYAITLTGPVARTYTYESQTASGFIINTNANQAFTGNVYWITKQLGET